MTKIKTPIVEQLLVDNGIKHYTTSEKSFLGYKHTKRHVLVFNGFKQVAKTKEELFGYTPAMVARLKEYLWDKLSEKYWIQKAKGNGEIKGITITLVDNKTNKVIFSEVTNDELFTLYSLIKTYVR